MKKLIQGALVAAVVAVSAPALADDHHDGDHHRGWGHHHRHQTCVWRHHHRVCFWR